MSRNCLGWPGGADCPQSTGEPFEYAFIQSRDAVKRPARLRWHRPLGPVRPQVPGELCVLCPVNTATATMTGRFEHAGMRAVRDRSNKIEIVEPMGFGHLHMWDSQLTLQSVSDVAAKPVDYSVPESAK